MTKPPELDPLGHCGFGSDIGRRKSTRWRIRRARHDTGGRRARKDEAAGRAPPQAQQPSRLLNSFAPFVFLASDHKEEDTQPYGSLFQRDARNLRLSAPQRQRQSMAARASGLGMVQFGEIEEPLCVVDEVLNHPNGNRALQVALSNEAAAWAGPIRGRIIDLMHQNVESWFGKSSPPQREADAMLVLGRNSIVLNCSKSLRCHRADQDSDELAIVDFADVAADDIIVPSSTLRASPSRPALHTSFNVHNVVVVDRKAEEEVQEDGAILLFAGAGGRDHRPVLLLYEERRRARTRSIRRRSRV